MSIKILDLFAGAGGLSLGFEMVKDKTGNQVFELHRAVEVDKHCCETLRKRHESDKIIEGDLTDEAIHKKVINECRNEISIVMGGIPCQSFSLLGPRSGSDEKKKKYLNDQRDILYTEFRDIVSQLKPHIFLIENVKGILSKKDNNGEKIIENIFIEFEKQGYNLQNNYNNEKYMILNAADYGVPQLRHRVIIIGIRKSWKDESVPFCEPTHYNSAMTDELQSDKSPLKPYVTMGDAIKDLPYLQAKITNTNLDNNQRKEIAEKNKIRNNGYDRIRFNNEHYKKYYKLASKSGKEFLDFIRPDGYEYIDHHTARGQKYSDIRLFRNMKQGELASHFIDRNPELGNELIIYDMNTFTDKYRKQHYNKPCTTIFAHLSKDGNRFIHPRQARTLTPREAARLQSFPDFILFSGGMIEKFKQIGNAVPPLMAYRIGLSLSNLYVSEDYGRN